ncbi:hypothetical protein GCM10009868_38140 [Terrabacter aerolatus]|uniref:DUF4177 domain-containing protein n=7 Tax=Terrabacter TaxID=53355 RepID=A0A512CVH4_9MICO|nr:hypothetical protein TAE01_00130 [Terrabacter aerolatus]
MDAAEVLAEGVAEALLVMGAIVPPASPAHPARAVPALSRVRAMTQWEYLTAPLLIHNTKQILDNFGADGWELVQIVNGPDGTSLVAYFKRPKS